VTTLLLVRHGLTKMTGPVLAGWTPGVHLDDRGQEQARALAERLSKVPVAGIVASPLERCQETASALAGGRDLAVVTDERLGECRYGDWTGQELKKLVKDPLWKVVQAHPSAAAFPGGEALRDTQNRAVDAVRDHNRSFGGDATWIAVSHGDVIKAVVADALGLHLDLFQRIQVDPASISVIRYTAARPYVLASNTHDGDLSWLAPSKKGRRPAGRGAEVGGGAGPAPASA
jgi:probable phosphomutase (TIGR03848 family)